MSIMTNGKWKSRYTKLDLDSLKEAEKRRNIETILSVSKIFQYGKTTIPKEVRVRLDIGDGDKLVWSLDDVGSIMVSKGHSDNSQNEELE